MAKKSSEKKQATEGAKASSQKGKADGVLSRFQKFQPMTVHRRQIKKAPYNPRQISPSSRRRLREGIKKFGFVGGIILNRKTGNLVGGHQRLNELDELEGTDDYSLTLDVIEVDESTERALNLLLNNPEAQGQFDLDMLQDVIGQLKEEGFDIHDAGFSTPVLHEMFGEDFFSEAFQNQVDQESSDIDSLSAMRDATKELEQPADEGDSAGGEQSAPADLEALRETDYEAYKKQLHEQRKDFREQATANEDAADTLVTLVFDRPEQIPAFLAAAELSEEERYFDAIDFARAINHEGLISALGG